ncbi:type IX secretion system periplasmic lipoprotein PorW/SprE, partial [Hymenobacter agri]
MKHHLLTIRWTTAWLVLLGLGMAGCASDKNIVSHAFNNVAARDNAYFIAREKLRGLEDKLYTTARPNDYNQPLPLFPTLDSASVKASRADLNDIIKRASMPIQHRPGSDWTDDAYVLVGWARFYLMQFDDAALTFKYVNSTSKDDNAKHEALIGLMRTFMAQGELESAKAVSDLLDKEQGRPEDARQLFLTRADYYMRTEEPAKAIVQLEKAIPLIEYKNERSRTRYLLAQLYQEAGENKKAYEQLDQILARNPPYELDFQAKLMMAQVSDLSTQDRARLDKNFAGLLKDLKNKDYRDKIYYEMARLNYREKNYPEALKLLRQSVRATTTNRFQKSYAYLLAGRIYYENLHKYPLAAAYYDSTVQNLNKEAKTYAAIKERSDILKDFAKQYTIIETQDSLQALAKLTPDALTERLNTYADAELAARKREADRQAALAKTQAR